MHGTLEALRSQYPGKWLLIELDDSEAETGTVLVAHKDPRDSRQGDGENFAARDDPAQALVRYLVHTRGPRPASHCSLAGVTFAGPARKWRRRPRADHGVSGLIEVMVREGWRPARAFGQVRLALDS